jgi:hypothetical protein
MLNVEQYAGLLEGGMTQTDLARGVLGLEVEEVLIQMNLSGTRFKSIQ